MARPTKLTPEVSERIIQAIRLGNYAEIAAQAAGISSSTYYRWLERGQQEKTGKYRDFQDAVRRAEAEAEAYAVGTIRRGMRDNPRLSMIWLERRFPERWQRRQRTDNAATGNTEPQDDLLKMLEGMQPEELLNYVGRFGVRIDKPVLIGMDAAPVDEPPKPAGTDGAPRKRRQGGDTDP